MGAAWRGQARLAGRMWLRGTCVKLKVLALWRFDLYLPGAPGGQSVATSGMPCVLVWSIHISRVGAAASHERAEIHFQQNDAHSLAGKCGCVALTR